MYPNGYITFRSDSSGCWSYIGQISTTGSQTINLSGGCVHQLVIEHEVLHAMGMYHEQSRPDRDQYITVNYENIEPNYHSQYNMISMSTWHSDGVAYDPESIMHYPWYGFLTSSASQQGLSAMTGKVAPYIGLPVQKPRQTRMTGRDAIQLQMMYEDYCPPLAQGLCLDGAPYLMSMKCDGHGDCAFAEDCNVDCDKTDEENCDATTTAGTTKSTAATTTAKPTTVQPEGIVSFIMHIALIKSALFVLYYPLLYFALTNTRIIRAKIGSAKSITVLNFQNRTTSSSHWIKKNRHDP